MNTNQIPELLSYEEAKEQLRANGCRWEAAETLVLGAESYLANPRWPDASVRPAQTWRAILESHVRHKKAERAERNGQPCPERMPCPHTLGEHRGVKGGLGCSVEGCPCNVQYVFALNGKDEIRFRADFTGTDKIAGEGRWQAFPLTVELAGIGVDIGYDGAANGEEEERHFIQIDASRFFRLAAAFVDCVRAGAEQRRLADVRAIRNHKDAETWIKRVSLAHAVEGILTLKTDADMGSRPIDNPGAIQENATTRQAAAWECGVLLAPWRVCYEIATHEGHPIEGRRCEKHAPKHYRPIEQTSAIEPWTFERLAEIPFVRRWMVDFMAVAVRDTLCAQRLEELLLLHRQVRDVSPYRTQEEDDTASSMLARAKHLGVIEQDATLPAREEIPPMPTELAALSSRPTRPIDAADDLYQELLAHFDGPPSGKSLFYGAVTSIRQHMAAYRDARDRERRGDTGATAPPSGLSAIMHDAHTHPRRHDPISLGEELDGPELDTFAAETVTAMDQLEKERGEK